MEVTTTTSSAGSVEVSSVPSVSSQRCSRSSSDHEELWPVRGRRWERRQPDDCPTSPESDELELTPPSSSPPCLVLDRTQRTTPSSTSSLHSHPRPSLLHIACPASRQDAQSGWPRCTTIDVSPRAPPVRSSPGHKTDSLASSTLVAFVLDWANTGGKTAMHVAAQEGNESFVRVSPAGQRVGYGGDLS